MRIGELWVLPQGEKVLLVNVELWSWRSVLRAVVEGPTPDIPGSDRDLTVGWTLVDSARRQLRYAKATRANALMVDDLSIVFEGAPSTKAQWLEVSHPLGHPVRIAL